MVEQDSPGIGDNFLVLYSSKVVAQDSPVRVLHCTRKVSARISKMPPITDLPEELASSPSACALAVPLNRPARAGVMVKMSRVARTDFVLIAMFVRMNFGLATMATKMLIC